MGKKLKQRNNYYVIIFFLVIVYFLFQIFSSELGKDSNKDNFVHSNSLSTNYTNPYLPHWQKMPLTYFFSSDNPCGELAKYRMVRAFNTIQNQTNNFVRFQEQTEYGDIAINCYEGFNHFSSAPGTYILGEGGPILEGDLITSARIELSNSRNNASFNGGCTQYSDGEIHEILHTFGIGHIETRKSIMNSIGIPCTHLDIEISGCLENIYSNGKNGTSCLDIPRITS